MTAVQVPEVEDIRRELFSSMEIEESMKMEMTFKTTKLPSGTKLADQVAFDHMAYPTTKRATILLVLAVFMILVMRSEARSLKLNGQTLLLELGYTKLKLEYYQRVSTQDSSTTRVAPGGPDPEHHSNPPVHHSIPQT
ncbi:hypothetical protein Dsin_031315 [Dipteronia sinensis]|uniref:Uncharacterized protein n=1 Tax=Dipteronia sinensis TaxID=43782 RepID=A0AAD9ZMK6_9ROSI|nr:hypothetical protein Dsin_031315 [Dipteronia sinensis]